METQEIQPQLSYNVMRNITISHKQIDKRGLWCESEFSADIVFLNPNTGKEMTKIKCWAISRKLGSFERALKEATQRFMDGIVSLGNFEINQGVSIDCDLCFDTIHHIDLTGYPKEWIDFFNTMAPSKDWKWAGLNDLKTTEVYEKD
jgi:hypothetical protein